MAKGMGWGRGGGGPSKFPTRRATFAPQVPSETCVDGAHCVGRSAKFLSLPDPLVATEGHAGKGSLPAAASAPRFRSQSPPQNGPRPAETSRWTAVWRCGCLGLWAMNFRPPAWVIRGTAPPHSEAVPGDLWREGGGGEQGVRVSDATCPKSRRIRRRFSWKVPYRLLRVECFYFVFLIGPCGREVCTIFIGRGVLSGLFD